MQDRTRTTLSLKTDLFQYGLTQSEKYFQGNFSMYVGFLISGCRTGLFSLDSVFNPNSASGQSVSSQSVSGQSVSSQSVSSHENLTDSEVDRFIGDIDKYFKC